MANFTVHNLQFVSVSRYRLATPAVKLREKLDVKLWKNVEHKIVNAPKGCE